MEPNNFQDDPHPSLHREEDHEKKIIPFERKGKKARLKSDLSTGAQIILFPNRHAKTNSQGKEQHRFKPEASKSSGLIGLIILILILALLLSL